MRTFSVLAFMIMLGLNWATLDPIRAADDPGAGANATLAAVTGLSPGDHVRLTERFRTEIWPLLTRKNELQKSCVECHGDGDENKSPLLLLDDPEDDFAALLADGDFEAGNPVALAAKLTHKTRKYRMPPPPGQEWSEGDLATLGRFLADVNARRAAATVAADEVFPAALLAPYDGPKPDEGPANSFLGYRQLKGKIQTIFHDNWRRDERDRFQENLVQFGGADFVRRFDESTRATPSFLSAVDELARDVATKAFLNGSGPFEGINTSRSEPDPADIAHLYRSLLYRAPTDTEQAAALELFRALQTRRAALESEDSVLAFELQMDDPQGLRTSQAFSIALTMDERGLYQERVDQTSSEGNELHRATLAGTFHFDPADGGQSLRVTNAGSDGNLSVSAIVIRRLGTEDERCVTVKDSAVQLEGSWQFLDRDGVTTCEDNNENKGESILTFPITVAEEGEFQVALLYRKTGGDMGLDRRGRPRPRPENAANVLVEVVSHDPSRLEAPRELPRPPASEAHFTIDQSVDSIAYSDLKTAFRFETDEHHVAVTNAGTTRPVVADAIHFFRNDTRGKPPAVVIDDPQAEGHEKWAPFNGGQFQPYNITGKGTISDNGKKSETLTLRYVPAKVASWDRSAFYRVAVGFPGKEGNETRAPIIIRAAASSPIVRLQAPGHAHAGALVTLDASASYNIQGTPLSATWVQVGGPKVALADPHALRTTFTAPVMTPRQAAWEGLARALIGHPDFLFSRPVSLDRVRDPIERARLQLVKIALDLVGRSPTKHEVERLEAGTPREALVNDYLESQDFRDFYFHRIRLYLESHGTEEQDEPVRLWTSIALHNRPFQEILTADYTVGPDLQRKDRPAYHGRTGILTTRGFIEGKSGLPSFNYAAQVAEKFLGYVFEVPPEIIAAREGITATATTDSKSLCYSCHKILTPLAFQREAWTDNGEFRSIREGKPVDDSDHDLVDSYPFKGKGMEAFAVQAQKKERFIRTMINTHFVFFFGREMRHNTDERALYKRLWDVCAASNYAIKDLIRALVLSPEYLEGEGGRP